MKKKVICIILALISLIACTSVTAVYADDSGYIISDEGLLPFEDVIEDSWYIDAVKFCYANGIINGMNEYTFSPDSNITRAQFVMMLANLEGVDTSVYTVTKFTDVKANHWYYGAVAWAYNEGIVVGTYEDLFEPNLIIQRQALCRMVALYMQSKGYNVDISDDPLGKFKDKNEVAFWAKNEVCYAVSAGLVTGMKANQLAPRLSVTRSQAARILMLYMKNYLYAGHDHIFGGQSCTDSGVCIHCGMVEGLPYGHKMIQYDCITGGVCVTCEKQVDPSNILHDFKRISCDKPRQCTRCGQQRGSGIAHKYVPATCTSPKTCSVCGVTSGNPSGHILYPATCTTGSKCGKCGYIEGAPLGHSTNNGICTRCKKEVFGTPQDKVIYYLKQHGKLIDNYYVYEGNILGGFGMEYNDIIYNTKTNKLCFSYENTYQDQHSIFIIDITQLTNYGYKYEHQYENLKTGEKVYDSGFLNTSDRSLDHSGYLGSENIRSEFEKHSETLVKRVLNNMTGELWKLCDFNGLDDFGFVN